MAVDANTRRPKLSKVVGGLSGPCVKPIALRMVWQCFNAIDIPILGMGGIVTAQDAIEFILCGATSIAVGTANFMNPKSCIDIIDGIEQYCERESICDISQLRGALEC